MPSLTRSTLVTRIGDLIGDPSNTLWSAAKKQNKIQEGQERFVLDTKILVDNVTDSIVADTAEYSLPTDVMDVNRVAHNNLELARRSRFELDLRTSTDWTDDTGTPKQYYVDLDPNNKVIRLYPTPTSSDAGTNNLKIEYIKIPPTLSADASVPFDSHTLLTPYHMAIAYWAAADLLRSGNGPFDITTTAAKIAMYEREYEKLVDHAVNRWRGMSESKQMRLFGGRYWKGL